MASFKPSFCFCTLALGHKYRVLTQELAADLEKFADGISLIVYTDDPKDFHKHKNVIAVKHYQQGILHCYNDKRFVMEMGLSKFSAAIYIDADTRIKSPIASDLTFKPGITAGHSENLMTHATKYNPERIPHFQNIASKLNLKIETVDYIGESLFILTCDEGKEIEFLKRWGKIAKYFELHGIHSGEGNAMGLAAAEIGWTVHTDNWQQIKDVTEHLDASHWSNKITKITKLKKRLAYHYRLNKSRIMALQNHQFFYN